MPRQLLSLAILALLCIAGGAWYFIAERPRPVTPATPTPSVPSNVDIHMSKVRFQGVNDGKVTWELEAGGIDLTKNVPVLHVDHLKKAVLLNGKKPELTLTASSLERNISSGDMAINGNVTITGNNLLLRTPAIKWNARTEVLTAPERIGVQAGDLTVSTLNSASYDVKAGTLRCDGSVILTVKGNMLRAGGANVNLRTQAFTLTKPVSAIFDIVDMESWTGGHNLPKIPAIPDSIKQRYREHLKNAAKIPATPPATSRRLPQPKGRPR